MLSPTLGKRYVVYIFSFDLCLPLWCGSCHPFLYQLYHGSCQVFSFSDVGRTMSPFQSDISRLFHLNPILESWKPSAIFPASSWYAFSSKVALVGAVTHLSQKLFSIFLAHCRSVSCRAWSFSKNLPASQKYATESKPKTFYFEVPVWVIL